MLIPLVILGLTAGAGVLAVKRPVGITPERKKVYEEAFKSLKEPEKLRELAEAFEKEGHKNEADMLRKRALLREAPPEVKQARRAAFKKAMASTNADAVRAMGDAYLSQGASGAARALYQYADGLKKGG